MATNDTTGQTIPPEHWIPHQVADHGDLDRPEPVYAEDLSGAAKSEFNAALDARRRAQKPKPRSKSGGAKRRRKKG